MTRGVYQTGVGGQLDVHWSEWFDGWTIAPEDDTTLLTGRLADQAALHGVLVKIRNLNLPFVLVSRIDPDQEESPADDTRGSEQGRR